jgi:hypothetical protein
VTVSATRRRASPSLRRGLRWTLAILLAIALLAAFSIRGSAIDATGIRGSADAVRLLASGIALAGAVVAALRASRSEAVGLGVAAATLALCVAGDLAVAAWWARVAPLSPAHLVAGSAAWSLAVLGLPILAGSLLLRIRAVDLAALPARPMGPTVAALVAGVLLYPALSVLQVGVDLLADVALGPSPGGSRLGWPGIRVAVMKEAFPASVSGQPLHLFVLLAVQLTLLEVLLHGVLRQAFLRWGALPFVVVTAVLAALVRLQTGVSLFAFGGSLVTGWLAARCGSVLPGIAFWTALFFGWISWGWLVPPG